MSQILIFNKFTVLWQQEEKHKIKFVIMSSLVILYTNTHTHIHSYSDTHTYIETWKTHTNKIKKNTFNKN